MKNTILILAVIFTNLFAFGQIKTGTITYEVLSQSLDTNLNLEAETDMFPGSNLRIDFTENKSRIQFELSRGFIITNTADFESNKGLKTFQSDQGNFAIPCTAEEAKMTFTEEKDKSKIELTDEVKKILNYTCKKAIVTKGETTTVYWYTEELDIDFSGQEILTTELPGFPMCFTSISDGIEMTFLASSFTTEITEKDVFSLDIPEGYIVSEKGF